MRPPRIRIRTLMIAVAVVALIPMGWNEWSGRRERYLELADRHARIAAELTRNLPGLWYWPKTAGYHVRMSKACKLAADRPYVDFLTGHWSLP